MDEDEKFEQIRAIRDEAYKIRQCKGEGSCAREYFPELGQCNQCGNLRGVVTEFGSRGAYCSAFGRLSGKQRITHCTSFWNITFLTIDQLLPMALFIDPKKEPIGF